MARIYLTQADPASPTHYDWGTQGTEYGRISEQVRLSVEVDCPVFPRCKYGKHAQLWVIQRVLADTFGHFPVFRINGERRVIDVSLPTNLVRIPRDARKLSPIETHNVWMDDNESHVFGGPNVAKALRASVAYHLRHHVPTSRSRGRTPDSREVI